jgi:hypothetical protein
MSDDGALRLALRDLHDEALARVVPPGVDVLAAAVRNRAQRRTALTLSLLIVVILGAAVAWGAWATAPVQPAGPTPEPTPTPSGAPNPSASSPAPLADRTTSAIRPGAGGGSSGPTACLIPSLWDLTQDSSGAWTATWRAGDPYECPQGANGPSSVFWASYEYRPDGSARLFSTGRYTLDRNHPKATFVIDGPGPCAYAAYYIVDGRFGPALVTLPAKDLVNEENSRPYQRGGQLYQHLWGVIPRCPPTTDPPPSP